MANVVIELDEFAHERMQSEAASQGVKLDELLRHALMYYLADLDSGRVASRALPEGSSERRQGSARNA